MGEQHLNTPVAFIIFNRPDTTQLVFEAIAKARPTRLLVVSDGPRANRQGEDELVRKTRAIIDQVDWPCEVSCNYSDINLGCKKRVSSGIDWVFDQVEEAIILEDDCLPNPSFFRFCSEMLERYRNDQRVGMISGDNFQWGRRRNKDSYYFSRIVHIWGWATWRDRWRDCYDVEVASWRDFRDEGWLYDLLGRKKDVSYWARTFDAVAEGRIDTWDFQWVFANWATGRLSVLPNVNLISNIGFGLDATHTTGDSEVANLPTEAIQFPLRHPTVFVPNTSFDRLTFDRLFSVSLNWRIRNKVDRIYKFLFRKL